MNGLEIIKGVDTTSVGDGGSEGVYSGTGTQFVNGGISGFKTV